MATVTDLSDKTIQKLAAAIGEATQKKTKAEKAEEKKEKKELARVFRLS